MKLNLGDSVIRRSGFALGSACAALVSACAALVSACAVLFATACSDSATKNDKVIHIGFLSDFSEVSLTQGRAAQLIVALQDINEHGGIVLPDGTYTLDLITEDHQGSPEGVTRGIQSLHDQGVTALVGPPWSSLVLGRKPDRSDGAVAIAKELKMVMVSGAATAVAISELDDQNLMWRTAPSDSVQSRVAADYLYHERGLKTAGVIYRDDAWGAGLQAAFTEVYESYGGQVVASVSYSADGAPSALTFKAQLDALFADLPEVIYLVNFDEVLSITNQIVAGQYLDQYSTGPLFFGTDGIYSKDLVNNLPVAVLRNLEGTIPGLRDDVPEFNALVRLIEESQVGDADGVDSNRHDAVYLLALAIQAAQSTDAEKIAQFLGPVSRADDGDVTVGVAEWSKAREALLAGKDVNYNGASGPIEFDDHGDITVGAIAIWQVSETSDGFSIYDSRVIDYDLR